MKVSIIVPVFNGKQVLKRCVNSILPQMSEQMELILVDDGSTDDSFALMQKEYQGNNQILLVRKAGREGPAAARNAGIRLARGELLAFCDVDDEWTPDKLSRQMSFLASNPETDIVFTDCNDICDEETCATEEIRKMAVRDKLKFPSAMIRRECFEKIGLLDESLLRGEDSEWFVRARTGGCRDAFLEEQLYIRHIFSGGLSATADPSGKKQRTVEAFIRGIRRQSFENEAICDLSILVPAFNAGRYIKEALNSCRSKKYRIEIITVSDGSDEDSVRELTEACWQIEKDFFDNSENTGNLTQVTCVLRGHKGQAPSRNDALHLARGRFILYLDADDYFCPGAVDVFMDAASRQVGNSAVVLVSALCRDFISPELSGEEAQKLQINPQPYRRMLAGCMLAGREAFKMIGEYDESMASSETAPWVMKIRDAGLKFLELDDVVLMRRYHRTNLGRMNRSQQMASYMAMIRGRLNKK